MNTAKELNLSEVTALIRDCLLETFGIVGIANIINKKGKKEEGIIITEHKDKTFSVDSYVIVSSGVKITETLRSAQTSTLYKLNKKYSKRFVAFNVYADSVSSK